VNNSNKVNIFQDTYGKRLAHLPTFVFIMLSLAMGASLSAWKKIRISANVALFDPYLVGEQTGFSSSGLQMKSYAYPERSSYKEYY
jgi:hypothetical protein